MSRNQFKKELQSIYQKANATDSKKIDMDRVQSIAQILNPDSEINQDQLRVMTHIDPISSKSTYMRIHSIDAYLKANLDGQKSINQKAMFRHTINNQDDLLMR